jgi:hypothetical protein
MYEVLEKLLLEIETANGRYRWAVEKVREDGPSARLSWILTETLIELRDLSIRLDALRKI